MLEIAHDVFDHHDRVVDDEADSDGQAHERQIVEAVTSCIHDAERRDQRQRHHHARDDRGPQIMQEQEDDHDDESDGQQQRQFDVVGRTRGCSASGRRQDRRGWISELTPAASASVP